MTVHERTSPTTHAPRTLVASCALAASVGRVAHGRLARGIKALAALACCLLLACAQAACGARSAVLSGAAAQVGERLATLEEWSASLKSGEEEARRRQSELSAARELLSKGNIYQSLVRLQAIEVELATRRYLASRAEVSAGGGEAFEREWRRLGGELEEKERRLDQQQGTTSATPPPAAVLALAESAQAQARPAYEAGRLYGLNTTVADGLHYLGRASALLDFALFCRGLRFEAERGAAPLRPLDAGLRKLEAETLAAYRRAEAASSETNERQALFNRLNSTLKLAAEMDVRGLRAGALHKYLEATLLFGLIEAAPPAPAELNQLKEESAAFERCFAAAGEDHTLALLFWEPARDALAGATAGEAAGGAPATAEELRRASIVVRRVLPAYFDDAPVATGSVAAEASTGGERVTVTLVRWPDT